MPIPDGMLAERNATLRIFVRADRLGPRCVADFERAYRCRVKTTTFSTTDEALTGLSGPQAGADVILAVPTTAMQQLITGHLIQPLNHSYLPNLSQVWPQLASPYYDEESRYTIPYTVYTTGIAWRKDQISGSPYLSASGWAFPWQPTYAGRVAILDEYREAVGLGLLYEEVTDLNTADPRLIDTAAAALERLSALVRLRISGSVDTDLASGRTWISQAWSGQAVAAARHLPTGVPADVIGYWFPPDGVGPVNNDIGAVIRGSRNPVLAHLFLNFLLDPVNAVTNMRGTGFMQPLNWLTPERMVRDAALPPGLASAAVLPTFLDRGLKEFQLLPSATLLWLQAWNTVRQHR